jgi:hypothetical protein
MIGGRTTNGRKGEGLMKKLSRSLFGMMVIAAVTLILSTTAWAARSSKTKDYSIQLSSDEVSFDDEVGVAVMVVLDVSGSMGDPPKSGDRSRPKIVQAAEAVDVLLKKIETYRTANPKAPIDVGLLIFSSGVGVLDEIGPFSYDRLKSSLSEVRYGGGTAIGMALDASVRNLLKSPYLTKIAVLVTDGESNTGPNPKDVVDAIIKNRNSIGLQTDLIQLFFVAFDIDKGLYSYVDGIGDVVPAADGPGLQRVLGNFFESKIKLELETKR